MTARSRRRLATTGTVVGVIAVAVICLFPFYWLINLSLRYGSELSSASVFPEHPTLRNYTSVLHDADFLAALRNSAVVATTTTLLALLVGAPAAYALAKLPLRRKGLILAGVLSVTTFPAIAVAAPLFKLWTDIGLYNTLAGLILPYLVFTLPLAVFILVAFFRDVPDELEEAAALDGLDPWRTFARIVLPLSAPALVTAALLTFIFAWNEFLLAITLTSTPHARTVPAAIAFFTGSIQYEQPLGTIAAASVLISVPLIVLVVIFQRRIVSGLVAGAVKG
ncbi:MAG: sugar ABC transporter permease [Cellulomonas sp. 73-92]|uniref:carbohydrate ABC transporter permease n=1 Tax=Cellulomonas sp. 73-92 TaxID=1895740 RepID=UPI0009295E62|nr:carbohydrate ABC transporter permease [Cellulomonas sp. 73-92]OJV81707.1 MAG: sugar ABC transporter permease [Cellulomonas sp. 73-92]